MEKLKLGKLFFTVLILQLGILQLSCNTTEPPEERNILLKLENASCTEAWITLSATNLQLPTLIELKQSAQTRLSINLTTTDSLLYIDSLLPNQTYQFQASGIWNPESDIRSNELTVTTMDTTNHNFTFETFTFGGEAGSSSFYDVAIINENCIYAVGEVYLKDSLGNYDPEQYAVAHWDGNKWELMKLRSNCRLYFPNCGPDTMLISSAHSIYARNENDIWIAAGSVHHYDGTKWTQEAGILGAGNANKIWGNVNELWFVGNNGFIAHRSQNGVWTKIESGTELNIYDILGQKTNSEEYEILCVAANLAVSTNKKIFRIENNVAVDLPTAGIPSSIKSIWFSPEKKYYVVGSGMFTKTDINSNYGWQSIWQGVTEYYTGSIDGNDLNDIVVCGSYGEMLHFNGITWKSYREEPELQGGSYGQVKINDNFIIAVGHNLSKAVISIGRRQ